MPAFLISFLIFNYILSFGFPSLTRDACVGVPLAMDSKVGKSTLQLIPLQDSIQEGQHSIGY